MAFNFVAKTEVLAGSSCCLQWWEMTQILVRIEETLSKLRKCSTASMILFVADTILVKNISSLKRGIT